MDIHSLKLKFIQEFIKINSQELVLKLDKFLREEKKKMYEKEIMPMSYKEFHSIIDRAEEDVENHRIVEVDELNKQVKKWK